MYGSYKPPGIAEYNERQILLLISKTVFTMVYSITYHHTLGDAEVRCYGWELAGILRNMLSLALQGHKFSNVTITKA